MKSSTSVLLLTGLFFAGCIGVPPGSGLPTLDGGVDAGDATSLPDSTPDPPVADAGDATATDMPSRDMADAASSDIGDAADVADDASDTNDAADTVDANDDPTALFVAGTPNPLTASDQHAVDLLTEAGFVVAVTDDDTVMDADGYDLAVVSKSCSSSTLAAVLADTPTGMLLWENRSQYVDRFNLIATTEAEYTTWNRDESDVWIESRPPISDQITGNLAAFPSNTTVWNVPESELGDGAEVIARSAMEASEVVSYIYDTDAIRPDGTPSPGRRAYVGYGENNVDALADDGELLFKRLARWASTR